MLIQITRSGTIFSGSPEDLERMREEFDGLHCVRLTKFLEPGLLRMIQRRIDEAQFYERLHKGVGLELCMQHQTTSALLHFLSNDPILFDLIQQITGCSPIGCFKGRVYRVIPGRGLYDSWHTDMTQHSIIAMSINLSTQVYRGGVLEIRDRESKRIVHEVANIGFGDAIIFRIASHLEHRITDVESNMAKTAFAGWFRSEPNWNALLKRFSKRRESQNVERGERAGRRRVTVRRHSATLPTVSLSDRANISDAVFFQNVGDETALFNAESGWYYGLEGVGTRFWAFLAEQGSLRAAFERLAEEYDAPLEDLRRDILRLVQELQANGLVIVS